MMQFPEPLFESFLTGEHLCLVCFKKKGESCLRTVDEEIIPVCEDCAADWRFYSYSILKRIKTRKLIFNIFVFKMRHLKPSFYTIFQDIIKFSKWAKKMKKFKNRF